ncbi:MAG: SRPBCC domain-containing protein [Acidimicrobiales bacterium]|nr:SRPBCC domain-containing protein [Acidimicrobiales bacterium]
MTDPTAPIATVLNDEGRLGLQYTRRLAHPPEKVWRALTESEHLVHWMPCDIVGERRAGATLELPFWPSVVEQYPDDTPLLRGEILDWDPPRRFHWTWDGDVLLWELHPTDGGTVLTFTTWLGSEDPKVVTGAGAGYHVCLDLLAALLDGSPVEQGIASADTTEWERRYGAAVEAAASPRR